MSSSDESEDGNLKNVLEAADTTLLSNSLFVEKESPARDVSKADDVAHAVGANEQPKSQRYLDDCDAVEKVEIQVSESMRDYVHKKLSNILEQQIEFVDPDEVVTYSNPKKTKSRLKLLENSDEYIKSVDESSKRDASEIRERQKKAVIKRRVIEDDHLDEEDKCKLAAVDPYLILSQEETKSWANRSKKQVFQYKSGSNGTLHFIEPTNEFTKIRKKNTWSEKRIARKLT